MSTNSLNAFLKDIKGDLDKSTGPWRKANSDLKPHLFAISVDGVAREVRDQLTGKINPAKGQLRGNAVTPQLDRAIKSGAKFFVRSMYRAFRPEVFNTNTKECISLIGNQQDFAAAITPVNNSNISMFEAIRRIKKVAQRKYVNVLDNELKKIQGATTIRQKRRTGKEDVQDFLDITHEGGTEVATQREQAVKRAFVALAERKGTYGIDLATLQKEYGLDLSVIKPEPDQIVVGLGGALANKLQGSQVEKPILEQVRKQVESVILRKGDNYLADLAGSDSARSYYRKKVLQALKFKGKGIEHNFKESTKIKKSNKKKTIKSKAKVAKAKKFIEPIDLSTISMASKKRESQTSPIQLAGLINQKLPATVAKNMGPPGLENVTGRFAASAKITDVTQTTKGFPSFGYTYEKNPYQVFEMGQGTPPWATPDRDPRNVINRSIREIAAEMAIGRFFTRRV